MFFTALRKLLSIHSDEHNFGAISIIFQLVRTFVILNFQIHAKIQPIAIPRKSCAVQFAVKLVCMVKLVLVIGIGIGIGIGNRYGQIGIGIGR